MAHPLDSGNPVIQSLVDDISARTVGKRSVVEHLICALIAGGHVLFEDIPGVGKTFVIKAMAQALGLTFKRIQCTPDLLPADIVGASVFHPQHATFDFRPGPIFTHLLLVDEINRSSPRTQSALLEAMEEQQVTVEGQTYPLSELFIILATENPLDTESAFPLPSSQLDRFLFRLSIGYPNPTEEIELLKQTASGGGPDTTRPVVMDVETLFNLRREAGQVHLSGSLLTYLSRLLQATRSHPDLKLGASPRAGAQWLRAAQAWALMQGRSYVIPEDLQGLARPVLGHRLVPERVGVSINDLIAHLLASTPLPRSEG